MERANRTLQNRLVKEMRLRGIGDMAAGNAYLPEFMADLNRRFTVAPRNPADAHRAVLHDPRELDLIPCEHDERKLTKNPTVGFECRECQETGRGMGCRPRGAAVTVCKAFDGSVTVLRAGRELPVRLLARGEAACGDLGLRSPRSPRPKPIRPHRRSAVIAHENAVGQRGHFNFGEKRTFLLCVDMGPAISVVQ